MKEKEINKTLEKLREDGLMKKHINLDTNEEPKFSLSKKGIEKIKEDLNNNPEAFAFMFKLTWNSLINEVEKAETSIQKILLVLDSCKSFPNLMCSDKQLYDVVDMMKISEEIGFDILDFKRKAFGINKKGDVINSSTKSKDEN